MLYYCEESESLLFIINLQTAQSPKIIFLRNLLLEALKMERSRWSRTENLNIWKDQFGKVKNMTSENPRDYETGDGFKIFDITQLSSFLPKNMANVKYNEPYRPIGSNPDYLYIDNEAA